MTIRCQTQEKEQYEDSLKSYRDLKNVIDTAYDEGELKGKLEAQKEMVLKGIARGLDNSMIADLSGLTEIEVEELRKKPIK